MTSHISTPIMALLIAAVVIALVAVGKAVTITNRKRPVAWQKSIDQKIIDDEEKAQVSQQDHSLLPPDFPITATDFWNAPESMHRCIDEYLETRNPLPDFLKYGAWSIQAEQMISMNGQHLIPRIYCSYTCARYGLFSKEEQVVSLAAHRCNGRNPAEKRAAAEAIIIQGKAFLLDKFNSCITELTPLLSILESAYLQGQPQAMIDAYVELRRRGVSVVELKRRLAYYTCPDVQSFSGIYLRDDRLLDYSVVLDV